jgi:hypothetical protein
MFSPTPEPAIAVARNLPGVQVPLPEPPPVPNSIPKATPTVDPNDPPSTEPAEFTLEQVPPTPVDTAGLSLGDGTYAQAGEFQVGLIEGYQVSTHAGIATIESPERQLAYTALSQQRANPRPLANDELVQIAIETLDRGEGFRIGNVTSSDASEVVATWTGRLGDTPLSGRVLVRQVDRQVLMLVVSATPEASDRLDGAIAVLSPTLQPAPVPESTTSQLLFGS